MLPAQDVVRQRARRRPTQVGRSEGSKASAAYSVVVVGGGIAGSTLAGVLVLEREIPFRDRVRGETTWLYGVADARRLVKRDVVAIH